mmetsp:Transcript_31380/g.56879  ORF Transcript_31380/g.56879 Transcript_31380/m.56879 type:complete len:95 (+) Transcript_31380:82-366(+)
MKSADAVNQALCLGDLSDSIRAMQPRIVMEKHKSPVGASAERRGHQSPPPPPLEDSIEHGHMLMKSLFITEEDSLSDCVPRLTCIWWQEKRRLV